MIQYDAEGWDRQRASRDLTKFRVLIFNVDFKNRPAILGRNGAASNTELEKLRRVSPFVSQLAYHFSDPLRNVEKPIIMIWPTDDCLAVSWKGQ